MAQQTINIGSSANKGDGEPLRTAFRKINENFTEVYTDISALKSGAIVADVKGTIVGDDSTILVDGVNSSINLAGTVKGDIIPDTNVAYDIGSATKRFKDLYLSGNTINLGGTTLSVAAGKLQVGGTDVGSTISFSELTNKPTTIAGYGITDALASTLASALDVNSQTLQNVQNVVSGDGQSIDFSYKTGASELNRFSITSTGTDFPSGTTVDFTGATVTGLSIPAGYTDSDVDTHLNTNTAGAGEVLSWTGADYDWVAQSGGGGLVDVVDDTSPQLGGGLDVQTFQIVSTAGNDIHLAPASGQQVVIGGTQTDGTANRHLQFSNPSTAQQAQTMGGSVDFSVRDLTASGVSDYARISGWAHGEGSNLSSLNKGSGLLEFYTRSDDYGPFNLYRMAYIDNGGFKIARGSLSFDAGTSLALGGNSISGVDNIAAGTLNNHTIPGGSAGTLALTSDLFDGNYNSLSNKPTIPADVGDLTDTGGLLGTDLSAVNQNYTPDTDNTYDLGVEAGNWLRTGYFKTGVVIGDDLFNAAALTRNVTGELVSSATINTSALTSSLDMTITAGSGGFIVWGEQPFNGGFAHSGFNGNGEMVWYGGNYAANGPTYQLDKNQANLQIGGAVTRTISGVTLGATTSLNFSDPYYKNPNSTVTITGVVGTTELNNQTYFINANNELFTDAALTTPLNSSAFTAYVSGGTAVVAPRATMSLPVLHSAPTTPKSGMMAVADGTNWNPTGTGTETMVVYLGGAWRTIANA